MQRDRLEGEFYDYLRQRGQISKDWNRQVLAFYVPWFTRCRSVLDVGCGEGQFLELLQAEGIAAAGIDVDARMVQGCRDEGLDVVQADLFAYLPQHEGQFDGIFCSNLIEHLSAEDALRFLCAAQRTLTPMGGLLVATPNPESVIVHLHEFWRDATHVRPYSRSLLEFLFHAAGFVEIQSGENPKTSWTPPSAVARLSQSVAATASTAGTVQADLAWPPVPQPAVERGAPLLRRLRFSLRRRVARFLAQTVLFEEFSSLNEGLLQLGYAQSDVQSMLFLRPREVFAWGVRPAVDREQARPGSRAE